jgi:hypothetical protein
MLSMGKSTISMASYSIAMLNYQRVIWLMSTPDESTPFTAV